MAFKVGSRSASGEGFRDPDLSGGEFASGVRVVSLPLADLAQEVASGGCPFCCKVLRRGRVRRKISKAALSRALIRLFGLSEETALEVSTGSVSMCFMLDDKENMGPRKN